MRTSVSSERNTSGIMLDSSELIALITHLDLCVDPGFILARVGFDTSLENPAAIHSDLIRIRWDHQIHARFNLLITEDMRIHRLRSSERNYLLVRAKGQCTGRTHARTHGFEALRSAVVAHVALHLQVHCRVILWNAEWACVNAVTAVEATRFEGGHDNAVLCLLDRVRGTDLRARWF